LAIRVARKLKAIDVIDVLSDLFILRHAATLRFPSPLVEPDELERGGQFEQVVPFSRASRRRPVQRVPLNVVSPAVDGLTTIQRWWWGHAEVHALGL
jgi:hypothetical protein